MKPVAWFHPALLLIAFAFALRADPLPAPHFDAYKWPATPMGVLGMPLGSFAVIEGVKRTSSKFVGNDDFVVASVNGIKPSHPVTLRIADGSMRQRDLKPGTRYVLHGWESGIWEGQPDGLPSSAEEGWTQGGVVGEGGFVFQHTFEISSVESVGGVPAPGAMPVDPKVPLTKPEFSKPPDASRPSGILGLPLGTFADIKAHRPERPLMMEDPFVIDSVNGVAAPKDLYVTIRNLKSKLGEVVSLHGYEVAEWGSTPELPKSENPSGGEVQQGFQLYPQFRVVQCK